MLFRLVRAHIITRRDLADRAIFLTMGSLRDEQRRPEAELWHQFELARPRILGALLEAVAHGLRMRDRIEFARLPRMANSQNWGPPAKPRSGHRVHSGWRTTPIGAGRWRMKPIRWLPACAQLWSNRRGG